MQFPTAWEIESYISREFSYRVVVGCELEFYFRCDQCSDTVYCLNKLWHTLSGYSGFEAIEREYGADQYELITKPYSDLKTLCADVCSMRAALEQVAVEMLGATFWESCPFYNMPGSAIHFHISLHDLIGGNIFSHGVDGAESKILLKVIDGLLYTLPIFMKFFAPTKDCYGRYRELPFPAVSFSPSRVCWGPDNRASAVRLPPVNGRDDVRRLEHRVTGAGANFERALAAVLVGVHHGLVTDKPEHHRRTFGAPNHPCYSNNMLPQSLCEAERVFNEKAEEILCKYDKVT